MATWKKVLTEDDLSQSQTNLAESNLTQTSPSRSYTLPENNTSANLNFVGVIGVNNINLLRIEVDSDSLALTQNYVYAAGLRIGNFITEDGTASASGYSLPQYASGNLAGNFMVLEDAEEVVFGEIDDLLGRPGYGGGQALHHPGGASWATFTPDENNDTVLVYDQSSSAFIHTKLTNLVSVFGFLTQERFRQTYSFGRNQDLSGSFFMRGTNGVQHESNFGYTVLRDSSFKKAGFSFEKNASTTTSSTTKRIKVYKNGTAIWYSDYVGSGGFGYFHEDFFIGDGVTIGGQTLDFSSGDQISVEVETSGSNSRNHQIMIELEQTI